MNFSECPAALKRAGGRTLRSESIAPGLRPRPLRRLPQVAFDELMWRLDQRRLERLIERTRYPR